MIQRLGWNRVLEPARIVVKVVATQEASCGAPRCLVTTGIS